MSPSFPWPQGKRAALSLSFDDGRPSQLSEGISLLDRLGVQATFYLNAPKLDAAQVPLWKAAHARGHEIGNHTCSHPCSGNFDWSRHNAIEDYTLERMEGEIVDCNTRLEAMLGVKPRTFAYPCGQTHVGRGQGVKSVVPLVAKHFKAGRAYFSEEPNEAAYVDLCLLGAEACDSVAFEAMKKGVDRAVETGRWLILAGHEMSARPGFQVTEISELEKLLNYVKDPALGIWCATVEAVAGHILSRRQAA